MEYNPEDPQGLLKNIKPLLNVMKETAKNHTQSRSFFNSLFDRDHADFYQFTFQCFEGSGLLSRFGFSASNLLFLNMNLEVDYGQPVIRSFTDKQKYIKHKLLRPRSAHVERIGCDEFKTVEAAQQHFENFCRQNDIRMLQGHAAGR